MTNSDSIRVNKFISESGFCSRRDADKLIESNRVKINGRRPELGTRVETGDKVTVDGNLIHSSAENKSDRVYLAYNKPVGITCTTERSVKENIVDAVGHHQRIFPIGRLDKPSEGLILMTSDGDIVNKILRAENAHEKEYVVTVNRPIGPGFVDKMSGGIPILDTVTKPCKVVPVGRFVFNITLTQGLNRQIRRMCEYLGYEVTQLARLRIMNIHLGKLKPGHWRNLTQREMAQLNAAISGSSGEALASLTPPPAKSNRSEVGRKPGRDGKPTDKQSEGKRPYKKSTKPAGAGKSRKSEGRKAPGRAGKSGGEKTTPSSRRRK